MFLFGAGKVLHECAGGIEEVLQRELEVRERGRGWGDGRVGGALGREMAACPQAAAKKTEHK